MVINRHLKTIVRLFFRRVFRTTLIMTCIYFIFLCRWHFNQISYHSFTETINSNNSCHFKPSTDEFIRNYKPNVFVENKLDLTRVEPTVERIRNLLEMLRSKEDKYQSLLETFDIFNMINSSISLKAYTDESNIEEIKILYDRYIKLMPDKKTVEIDITFIDYLRKISSYLLDGLKNKRTNIFQVECYRKPTFVLACNEPFFDVLQGAIHTLDTYWSDHKIIFYDMGLSSEQKKLLKTKCTQCTIIEFPFSAIEKFAPHIHTLQNYAFKPFVVQDALRRYGTIIYGDSSARFNEISFNPVLIDNYIRGFATRELPNHFLPCFTHSGSFVWFNQSYTQYDNIYMAEGNFLVVTDTFLSRLIMKAWLICALEPDCLISEKSATKCRRASSGVHRFDQSVMVIILTHFFFQGNQLTWGKAHLNDPAPYDMFTSIQKNLGDIRRGAVEADYLSVKKTF